ncbi:MAG: recombinase family protein [Isosphaeraceae bacterium]
MRAALYARVSTHDQQTLDLQIEAMKSYAKKREWEIARQVKDVGSGAKDRAGREALLKAARSAKWTSSWSGRLDRWGGR